MITMYPISAFLSLFALLSSANAAPGTRARTELAQNAKAVYLLSNEVQNSVVALKVNSDGTLSPGSVHLTGGKGGASIDSATNKTAVTDVLISQSALKVDGNVCTSPLLVSEQS